MENHFLLMALYQTAKGYDSSYDEFIRQLPQNGLLLDIGANLGVTTAAAKRIRPDIRVKAFEPISVNILTARRLHRILRLKGVEMFEIALGDMEGSATMVMPILKGLASSGQTYVQTSEYDYSNILGHEGLKYTVPVRTIDSLNLERVSGIKLDVENFELHVLKGASALLRRDHPTIYCELWDTENRYQVIELLVEHGYKCRKLPTKEDYLFS